MADKTLLKNGTVLTMDKEIGKLSGHYIVCGGGHAGSVIAAELGRTQRPCAVPVRARAPCPRAEQPRHGMYSTPIDGKIGKPRV